MVSRRIVVHRDFERILEQYKFELERDGWPRVSNPQASRLLAKEFMDLRCNIGKNKKNRR